ncbi:MAG TPA: DUF3426 domain-containing protein [Marinobacter sp.]|nr:DUF3426 domain-containing protein [Marinobacter sp.]
MTQSSLQTQCPKCETRFRVTDEQLSIAGGKVRCGSCMSVFNAVEHQVASLSDSKPATSDKPSASDAPKSPDSDNTRNDLIDDDFVFADNPEEDAAEGPYAGSKLTFSDDELSDSFLSVDREEEHGFTDDELSPKEQQVDESWAEAMLSDDEPARPLARKAAREPEPEPEPEKVHEPTEPASQPEARKPMAASELSLSLSADDDRVGDPMVNRTRPDRRTDTLYQDLRRDPVSVGSGGSRMRTALWSLVVLALIGVLIAQVTWFQFDRLSAIPQLRPFYEQGCELAGCELKPLIDVESIQSRKLVVRTDPDNRTQLIVDAVIINRAGFEQPFPAIALTFSNLNGDVVAQSTFTPEEYLAGEAEGLNSMPVEVPVQIAISIRDPGRDAVNYNLIFRPSPP